MMKGDQQPSDHAKNREECRKKSYCPGRCRRGMTDSLSRAELVKELNHLRMELAYLKKLNALVQATDGQVPPSERA